MTAHEIKQAKDLLEPYVNRTETAIDGTGQCLTAYSISGYQWLFYSLDVVIEYVDDLETVAHQRYVNRLMPLLREAFEGVCDRSGWTDEVWSDGTTTSHEAAARDWLEDGEDMDPNEPTDDAVLEYSCLLYDALADKYELIDEDG